MAELVQDKNEYHIEKFPYNVVHTLLQYLYSGKALITDDNVNNLLNLCDKFKITKLRAACFDFIITSLDEDSVAEVLDKAKKKEYEFDTTELISKCIEVITKKSEGFFQGDQFLEFDKNIVETLVKSDNICVDEIELFKAVIKWGKKRCKDQENFSDLKDVLQNIIPNIRYPLLSPEELINIVKPTKLCPPDLYLQALTYYSCPEDFKDKIDKDPQFKDRGQVLTGSKLLNSKQSMILLKWIQTTRHKGKHWKLCYRASRDVSILFMIEYLFCRDGHHHFSIPAAIMLVQLL